MKLISLFFMSKNLRYILTMTCDQQRVLEILNDFYGEEHVDMQEGLIANTILIYFPKVHISNERNESLIISELYVKFSIYTDGTLAQPPALGRAEYTKAELAKNYMHSHVRFISKDEDNMFVVPCLGRGPIRDTVCTLTSSSDSDIWMLFCVELQKFVETESVKGVPYHYLREVANIRPRELSYTSLGTHHTIALEIEPFIPYLVRHIKLPIVYRDNCFQLGMPFRDYVLMLSDIFIQWSNSRNDSNRGNIDTNMLLYNVMYMNKGLYIEEDENISVEDNIRGKRLCIFKGRPVLVKIVGSHPTDTNVEYVTIVSPNIASYILNKILATINYHG